MAEQDAKPSGPDLSQGVAFSDLADMAQKHGAVGEVGEGNTLAQIGPAGLGVLLSHCNLPHRS